MFIGLFVALVSAEAGNIIQTPLVTNSAKFPHFFEVRDDQVVYVDHQTIDQQVDRLLASLPACRRPEDTFSDADSYFYEYYIQQMQQYNNCLQNKIEQLETIRFETAHYRVKFVNLDSLLYEPIESAPGETPEELSQKGSEFSTILKQLDPINDYLAFVVRPDSFDAFRKARAQARRAGFEVGWEPYQEETPIVFGSGGRSIGVQ